MNRKKRFVHLLLGAIVVLLVAFAPRAARADGGVFLYGRDADVSMPDQKAIIVYDEETGREDLILSVGLMGESPEVAWVVPVPSLPEVNTASEEWFEQLSDLTQPEIRTHRIVVSEPVPPTEEPAGGVTLHSREQVGVYDVSILSSDQPGELFEWLNENGYAFPEEGRPLLDTYETEGGWYFVAVRVLSGESAFVEGDVQPLWLSFDVDQPIYPMRLTTLVADYWMEILIYVLGDHRMQLDEYGFETEFAGALMLRPEASEEDELNDLLTRRPYYVTKLRWWGYPASMTDDLDLRRASTDDPYRMIVHETVYVIQTRTPFPPTSTATPTLPPVAVRFPAFCGLLLVVCLVVVGIGGGLVLWLRSRSGV